MEWIVIASFTMRLFPFWQIQKFALRFPSIYEAQSFINALKVTVAYHNTWNQGLHF